MHITRSRRLKGTSSAELRVSVVRESHTSYQADTPDDAARYWSEFIATATWYDPEREQLIACAVNTRNRITGHSIVCIGSINECVCHPREVFRPAIAMNFHSVIVMHNHPSGITTPSQPDIVMTRRLKEAGMLLQIALLDHVIIGTSPEPERRCSFREAGNF